MHSRSTFSIHTRVIKTKKNWLLIMVAILFIRKSDVLVNLGITVKNNHITHRSMSPHRSRIETQIPVEIVRILILHLHDEQYFDCKSSYQPKRGQLRIHNRYFPKSVCYFLHSQSLRPIFRYIFWRNHFDPYYLEPFTMWIFAYTYGS